MNGLRPFDNPRMRGTNPRAKGTNPRALGINPRAALTAAQRFDELERRARRQRELERLEGAHTAGSRPVVELEREQRNRDAIRRRILDLRALWSGALTST